MQQEWPAGGPADGVNEAERILQLIEGRRSVRGYLDRPVPRMIIERLLAVASRAPSGNNMQPWRIHVVTGDTKERLIAAIAAARGGGEPDPPLEYRYAPADLPVPYRERRREVGWALYQLLGIEKGDLTGARAWQDRNLTFFGAPVGMILTLDRRLGVGAFMDCGLFLQGLAIGARAVGLETCFQVVFAAQHDAIRQVLALPDHEMVVCGIALGYENLEEVANRLRTTRSPVSEFAVFHDGAGSPPER